MYYIVGAPELSATGVGEDFCRVLLRVQLAERAAAVTEKTLEVLTQLPDWPKMAVEVEGKKFRRPTILVRAAAGCAPQRARRPAKKP